MTVVPSRFLGQEALGGYGWDLLALRSLAAGWLARTSPARPAPKPDFVCSFEVGPR
jgi:hypothetical protein